MDFKYNNRFPISSTPFSSNSSGNSSTQRHFNGPNDKKKFYISELTNCIVSNEIGAKKFSKAELAEIQTILRKTISTNPSLFRIIQTIVDDIVFLDKDVLEMMDNDDTIPDYNIESINSLYSTVQIQNRLKHLSEFNAQQLIGRFDTINNYSACSNITNNSRLPFDDHAICKRIHSKTNENFLRTAPFITLHNRMDLQEKFSIELEQIVEHFIYYENIIKRFEPQLMSQLFNFDKIILNYYGKQVGENRHLEKSQLQVEILPETKLKLVFLKDMFKHLYQMMVEFEKKISNYKKCYLIETDVCLIVDKIEQEYKSLLKKQQNYTNSSDFIPLSSNAIINYISRSLNDIDVNPFIQLFRALDKEIVLLEHKLKMIKKDNK